MEPTPQDIESSGPYREPDNRNSWLPLAALALMFALGLFAGYFAQLTNHDPTLDARSDTLPVRARAGVD